MKITEPKEGAIYWCTLPVDESASHGDTDARYPWKGKFHFYENGVGHLYSYCEETGDIDDDSNAKAFVTNGYSTEPIFDCERDAIEHFINELDEEITAGSKVLLEKAKLIQEMRQKITVSESDIVNPIHRDQQ